MLCNASVSVRTYAGICLRGPRSARARVRSVTSFLRELSEIKSHSSFNSNQPHAARTVVFIVLLCASFTRKVSEF